MKYEIIKQLMRVCPEALDLYYLHPDGSIRLFRYTDHAYMGKAQQGRKYPNPPAIPPELLAAMPEGLEQQVLSAGS